MTLARCHHCGDRPTWPFELYPEQSVPLCEQCWGDEAADRAARDDDDPDLDDQR